MSARAAILERLRMARAAVHLPRDQYRDVPPTIADAAADGESDLVARFLHELQRLGVECHHEATAAAVRARLAALLSAQPGHSILSWTPAHLPYEAGAVLAAPMQGDAARAELAAAAVGITGCDAAIADTGTLAVLAAPGRSRAVSLLPPWHVALVERRQLLPSMAAFLARHGDEVRRTACCTFITGPSRTADIELTLTLGIHGPGRVTVILGP